MSDTAEQAQMRQHLSEMRRAAGGLGHDVSLKMRNLEREIDRLSTRTGRDLRDDVRDIEDGFLRLSKEIDSQLVALPHNVKEKAYAAGAAISSGTAAAFGATRDAVDAAGHRTIQGSKDALARAAGVNKKPMKQWHQPSPNDD